MKIRCGCGVVLLAPAAAAAGGGRRRWRSGPGSGLVRPPALGRSGEQIPKSFFLYIKKSKHVWLTMFNRIALRGAAVANN